MTGSATTPSDVEQTVTPSWAAASIKETCSIAHSTTRARRDPASASGSTALRRAEMIANSAPTKNALPASNAALTARAHPVLTDPPRAR